MFRLAVAHAIQRPDFCSLETLARYAKDDIEYLRKENQELKEQIVKYMTSRSIEFPWVGATVLYQGQRQAPWEYYLNLAQMAATRSPCLHRHVGAVLVKDGRICATGYNGPASDVAHCQKCERVPGKDLHVCQAIHAEENALLQCALYGPSTIGASLYCTHAPCFHCAKLIKQCKIADMTYIYDYPDRTGLEYLEKNGINVNQGAI